jgi:hypothetical protein
MVAESAQKDMPRSHRAIRFLVSFLLFVAVGKSFELLGDPNAVGAAYELQRGWLRTVEQMSPWRLSDTFVATTSEGCRIGHGQEQCLRSCPGFFPGDCRAVSACPFLRFEPCKSLEPGSFPLFDKAAQARCDQEKQEALQTCEREDERCEENQRGARTCIENCRSQYRATEDLCKSVEGLAFGLYYGLANTVGQLWRTSEFFVLFQLLLGVLAFAALRRVRIMGKQVLNFGSHLTFIEIPVGVIGLGILIAFVLKVLMLGALMALSWVTGFVGLAAGATGVLGMLWYFVLKIGEKAAEHAVSEKFRS